MRELRFNFNNDVDTFAIREEDDGRITVPVPGGDPVVYNSIEQFAEMYAQSRDVKPEHLKNWTLVEHGDVVSFVLRAGTAGVGEISGGEIRNMIQAQEASGNAANGDGTLPVISAESIQDKIQTVMAELRREGLFHPLELERVRQELLSSADVVNTLAMSASANVAREIYDRLAAIGAFTLPEPEPVVEDTRSDLEKYLDRVMEQDHTLAFFTAMLHLDGNADKDEVLRALETSTIPYTVAMLDQMYEDAVHEAKANGIHVADRFDALLVITQTVPGGASEDTKAKLMTAARLARRDGVNLSTYMVGHRHIKKTAQLYALDEMDGVNVFLYGNTPICVIFDPEVDETLERERAEAEAEHPDQEPDNDDVFGGYGAFGDEE